MSENKLDSLQKLENHLNQTQKRRSQNHDRKIITERAEKLVSNENLNAPTDAERKRTQSLKNDNLATDIGLKRRYGNWLIGIMIVQLIIMNLVFILVGLNRIQYSEYVLHLYISGTLLELFGLVLVITKYLFKK